MDTIVGMISPDYGIARYVCMHIDAQSTHMILAYLDNR